MSRKSLKWLPALVVPAVIAVAVVSVPLQAGAAVDLPDKSADEVLLLIGESTEDSFSGTVEKTAELGLPTLPGGMDSVAPDSEAGIVGSAIELLSGTQEARVFANGPMNLRVEVKDTLASRTAVTNGAEAWYYDSETDVATHVTIPADATDAIRDKLEDSADLPTPAQVADRILDELGPSTDFAVGTDAKVAGRTVYELVLTPKASGTLAESVSISVDSETGLPLQVSVGATGQDAAAFQIGFTSIDLQAPAAELFEYVPAPGVTVDEQQLPSGGGIPMRHGAEPQTDSPVVTGTGWDAIVEVPAASVSTELSANPLFEQLTTQVDGGRLFSTALVNVLLTNDGRMLAGSVPADRLLAAADAG